MFMFAQEIMVFYNKLRGGTGVVDGLYPTTTIKELQKKIFRKEHVPGDPSTRCITFWLGRKELRYDDDRTVADYGMVKDDSILLTLPSSKAHDRHDSRRPCHEVSELPVNMWRGYFLCTCSVAAPDFYHVSCLFFYASGRMYNANHLYRCWQTGGFLVVSVFFGCVPCASVVDTLLPGSRFGSCTV